MSPANELLCEKQNHTRSAECRGCDNGSCGRDGKRSSGKRRNEEVPFRVVLPVPEKRNDALELSGLRAHRKRKRGLPASVRALSWQAVLYTIVR
jgi:hypothetical protein